MHTSQIATLFWRSVFKLFSLIALLANQYGGYIFKYKLLKSLRRHDATVFTTVLHIGHDATVFTTALHIGHVNIFPSNANAFAHNILKVWEWHQRRSLQGGVLNVNKIEFVQQKSLEISFQLPFKIMH